MTSAISLVVSYHLPLVNQVEEHCGVNLPADRTVFVSPPLPALLDARLCHVIHDEILLEAPEAIAQAAADLLLDVMQDPGLQTRYLRDVLPLVA